MESQERRKQLAQFKPTKCLRAGHNAPFQQVCIEPDCPKFLASCCEKCLKEHEHGGYTLKELAKLLEIVSNEAWHLKDFIDENKKNIEKINVMFDALINNFGNI